MKTLLLLACAIATAQNVELVPLTTGETSTLKKLDAEVKRTEAINQKAVKDWLAAQQAFCRALADVKKAHKLSEPKGGCLNGSWYPDSNSGIVVTGNYISGTGPEWGQVWTTDTTMKYLVHK